MQRLLRHFWIPTLGFLFASAFLVVQTVATLLDGQRPLPLPDTPALRPVAGAPGTRPELSAAALDRLMGLDEKTETISSGTSPAAAPRSPLSFTLLGTSISDNPLLSMASLQEASGLHCVCMLGDRIDGAEVVAIERLRVLVERDGSTEVIDRSPASGDDSSAASGTPSADQQPAAELFTISRDELLMELNRVNSPIRLVPAWEDGAPIGWRIFGVRPDSLSARAGLQTRDLIRRVNGYNMDSADNLVQLFEPLPTTSQLEIELRRNGVEHRITVLFH